MITYPVYDGEIDVDGTWEHGEPPLIHFKSSRGVPQCRVRLSIEQAEDLIAEIRDQIDGLKGRNAGRMGPDGDFVDADYRPRRLNQDAGHPGEPIRVAVAGPDLLPKYVDVTDVNGKVIERYYP